MKQYYFLFVFLLCSIFVFSQVPPNDEIQNAINIISLPFTDANVQIQNASTASGGSMLSCDLDNSFSRIYYRYAPTQNINFAVNMISSSISDGFVLIYQSSVANPTSDNQLSFIGSNCALDNSYEAISLVSGNVYYILAGNDTSAVDIIFSDTSAPIVNIPDSALKNKLISHSDPIIDTSGDGEIQVYEAVIPTVLELEGSGFSSPEIVDLTGIEMFTNLEDLNISYNSIDYFDFGQIPSLKKLSCQYNEMSNLNLQNNTNLVTLYCQSNELTNLNISQNTLLESLDCHSNQLSTLDISQNILLESLDCRSNQLSELDISQNTSLKVLNCSSNQLSNIDVSQNLILEELNCSSNNISSINVTQNLVLNSIDISNSLISNIDISQNIALESFYCIYSQIPSFDVSQNSQLKKLDCGGPDLISLDVTQNSSLEELGLRYTSIESIDVSQNPLLTTLYGNDNLLTNLDISQNLLLEILVCQNNQLASLDVTPHSELFLLRAWNNSFTSLDLSQNPLLAGIHIHSNYFLESLNLHNGSNTSLYYNTVSLYNCPNLQSVCVDDINYAYNNFFNRSPQTVFVEDCSVLGSSNIIEGTLTFDENNNGCDVSDSNFSNVKVVTTDGLNQFSTFTNDIGYYKLFVQEGTYSTFPVMPSHFTLTPVNELDTFIGYENTEIADFCITSNATVNDLNIVLLPLSEARPGFDAQYQIIYENTGTTTLNGTVNLQFDDTMQTFVNASPIENASTVNTLSFNFTDLLPFESRIIDVSMNTFPPPTVNGDDILNLVASVSPSAGDSTPENNTFSLAQLVVNSFDPNDKQVLQGSEILLEQADEYLHYLIRFQNTGTASAINVAVTDELNDKLDWNLISPISSSHPYTVQITNGRFVEFIFDNINLPAQQDDDLGSNGFIAFKIKPRQNVVVGDIINGQANIYFDFNLPIITNEVSTEIVDTLSDDDFTINESLIIYPNPSSGIVNIETTNGTQIKTISIYGFKGELVFKNDRPKDHFDISNLTTGIYFVSIETNKGVFNKRIIKN